MTSCCLTDTITKYTVCVPAKHFCNIILFYRDRAENFPPNPQVDYRLPIAANCIHSHPPSSANTIVDPRVSHTAGIPWLTSQERPLVCIGLFFYLLSYFTIWHILLRLSNQSWGKRRMWPVCVWREMQTEFWSRNLKERDKLEGIGIVLRGILTV